MTMNSVPSASEPFASSGRLAPHDSSPAVTPANPAFESPAPRNPTELDFNRLRTAYRATGGVVCAQELARLLEENRRAYTMSLEKLIFLGAVFGFEWRGTVWIPMFQFERPALAVKPAPRRVLAEVDRQADRWRVAAWFVRPCPALADRSPVDVLDSNLPQVLLAARTDRFIACA